MKKTTDLTKGEPLKLILFFALPIFLGNFFQQIYNIADTMIVGYTLGESQLAAMGSTGPLYNLIIGFVFGITNGFALITAKWFGADNIKNMKKAIGGTIILGFIISTALTVISLVFSKSILMLLKTPEDIIDSANGYISIIIAGAVVTMLYNMLAGILRAVGNSKAPVIFLIIATICNVGFDFLFIKGFKLGIKGAAYATVLAQGVAVILCIIYILKQFRFLIPEKEDFKISREMLSELLISGLSMALMLSIVSIGSIILQSAVNSFGTSTITSHTAARKISEMFMLVLSTFASASATFASQNYGAKQYHRIKQGVWASIKLDFIWCIAINIIILVAAPFIVSALIGTKDSQIIDTSVRYLRWNLPFYFILSPLLVFRTAMQGIGKNFTPLIASAIEFGLKILVVVWLAPKFGYFGVIISEPVIWIICAVFLAIMFFSDDTIKAAFSSDKIQQDL